MLQPIIEGETAHFFEEIKVILKRNNSVIFFPKGKVETMACLILCLYIYIQEEEEDGVCLSSELSDILKTAVQAQSSLENSESDVEENQEKLALDLRLSSTRAASMYVCWFVILAYLWKKYSKIYTQRNFSVK